MKLGSNCARCTRAHTQVTCVEIRLIPKRVATMSCALLSLMRGREAENKGECEEDWIKECSSPWAAYKNTHSGILFRLVIHSWLFNLGFSFGPCLSSWTWFTLYTLVFFLSLSFSLSPSLYSLCFSSCTYSLLRSRTLRVLWVLVPKDLVSVALPLREGSASQWRMWCSAV